jgi:hypothetical protein
MGWGHPLLDFAVRGSRPKFSHLLFELLLDFDDISVGHAPRMRCPKTPFCPICIYADHHDT